VNELWRRLRVLFRRQRFDRDLEEEMQAHLETQAEENEANGMPAEEARYAARRQFGNATHLKEVSKDMWGWASLERLAWDVRYALRTLRRAPGFAAVVVTILALGIGANTAVFSVVDAVLLRPLPLAGADRIVCVWEENLRLGWPQLTPAPANFVDWRVRNHVFTDMAALQGMIYAITGDGTPEEVEGNPVTANLFPLLGVSPILGRHFAPEEDRPGARKVALISYGLWQRRFGGAASALGRDVRLDGVPHRIVGVMPRGFAFPERSDVWVPIGFTSRQLAMRDNHYLRVFARLKPGVTLVRARRDMARVAADLAREYPATNTDLGAVVIGLQEQMVGDTRLGLWALFGGVGCLLLLACANVSGLLLVRNISRSREMAVRVALGAGKWQLTRQAIAESLVLAIPGAAAGCLLALWSIRFLARLIPPELTGWSQPDLDVRLAAFTGTAALVSALMAGVIPALATSRVDPARPLQQGGRAAIGGQTLARRALVVGQLALTAVLSVGAGLLVQTLWKLAHVELGFRPEGVLTARTSLPASSVSPYREFAQRGQFYQQVLERVRTMPGVVSAGYTTFLPLTNGGGTSFFSIEGAPPPPPGHNNDANHRVVTQDYLQTMGFRLRVGRFFEASDGPTSMPVAIINEAMVRRYWPGQDPLGGRIRLGGSDAPWITIVGVVDSVRQDRLELEGRPEMYFPSTQPFASYGWTAPRDLAVRVQGDPLRYAAAVRQAVWAVDPHQPISDIRPMQQLVNNELAFRDTQVRLLGAFAALALLLASVGLYGLLACDVAQRRRDIGVRLAVGATPGEALALVLRQGLMLALAGIGIGVALAFGAARLLSSLLYGVSSTDPAAFLVAAALLFVSALAASLIPARRAARIDPMEALRCE